MLGNRSILFTGLIIGCLTYAVMSWSRTYHPMVSDPTAGERILALVIWISCIAIYFLFIPIGITQSKVHNKLPQWPVKGAVLLAIGIGIFYIFFSGLLSQPRLFFNPDMELFFVLYLASSVAYVLSVAEVVSSWRVSAWAKLVANLSMSVVSGLVIFACSWAVLYLE